MYSNYCQYQSPICLLTNSAFKKAKNLNDLQNLLGFKQFQSVNEYQKRFFPLFQNEYYQSISKDKRKFQELLEEDKSYPLKLIIQICPDKDQYNYKFQIKSEESIQDEVLTSKKIWKYAHYSNYLAFKMSTQFIGAVYVQDQINFEYYPSLAIFQKQTDGQYLLFPNNIDIYFPKRIFQSEADIYFQPICPLSAYSTETQVLFELDNCPYYNLILNPTEELNITKNSDYAKTVRTQQETYFKNEIFIKQFNRQQLNGIYDALDFNKRFTIIKGPPGTGKTQTIIGIISIMAQLLNKKEKEQIGVILILAKTNSVVNDLVRKIKKNILEKDSIIYCSDQSPDFLKVIRFGRPNLCDQDIAEDSLEIQTQNRIYQKFNKIITELKNLHLKQNVNVKIKNMQQENYDEYLQTTKQQITLISLLNYIDELNKFCLDTQILDAFGNFYQALSKFYKSKQEKFEKYQQKLLDKTHIIITTLNSCSKHSIAQYLEKVNLRICIVDEAPTALEPSQLIPFVKYTKIQKVILLGDINQLSPIFKAKESSDYTFNRSFFERLQKGLNKSTFELIYQYRQIANLAEITSKFFYQNSLENGNQIWQLPDWISSKVHSNKNRLFFSAPSNTESKVETSKKNDLECLAIVKLIKYLLGNLDFKHKKQITIISGYLAQKKSLFKILSNEPHKIIDSANGYKKIIKLIDMVELDTIDSFQGKENDIIILSLVRSDEEVGFLTDKKRTNVALSRARFCQFIFGTYSTMKRNLLNWNKVLQMLEQNQEIINYKEEDLDNPDFYKEKLSLQDLNII